MSTPDNSIATGSAPPDLWEDDRGLAARTPIARATWQRWRLTGEGPPFARVNRRCLYHWPTVHAWLLSRTSGSAR